MRSRVYIGELKWLVAMSGGAVPSAVLKAKEMPKWLDLISVTLVQHSAPNADRGEYVSMVWMETTNLGTGPLSSLWLSPKRNGTANQT